MLDKADFPALSGTESTREVLCHMATWYPDDPV